MPDYRDAFPAKFLRAEDIVQGYDCTTDHVDYDNVGTEDKPEKKLVAQFKEPTAKPIVLNKTRCEVLEEITGTRDYAKWAGVRVRVSKGTTRYAGKRVPCIELSATDVTF